MEKETTMIELENIIAGLNEAQAKAVSNPIDSCTKIVAGAGTGKTKIISKRFLKLVNDLKKLGQDNPQSKILVITFTDKAANEMKTRIVDELENNGIETSAQTDLWISTFHGFCIKILKKYSIEAGLSPSFKMGEEQELKNIYDNLVKRIKYGETHTFENFADTMSCLGLEQDLLSIKSLTLLCDIEDMDNLFEDIFAVIKKIKALGLNSKEFLQKSVDSIKKYSDCVEKTPFKFESKEDYARAWGEHFRPYTDDTCIFDEKVFDSIAKEKLILDKFGKRKAIEYGMAQGFPENIKPISDVEIKLACVIAAVYELYQQALEKADIADFDDLINKTIQIFKNNEMIRSFYQNYFKQIIVDEFQDTNGAQLELIELLLNNKYPNLTFVGDRKQSIYAFRYAQMENLEVLHKNVEKKYSKNFEPINLSINYRSTPEVLNAVNFVTEKELCLEGENLFANPNLTYQDTSKDIKVTVIDNFENAYELRLKEAEYIALEIENLINRDKAKYKDFAVLVKSHAQADIVEKELKKRNIPSVKKVNTGFFFEPVVKNVFAALRLVKNLEDEQAFFRLLKTVLTDSEIFEMKKMFDKELYKTMSFDEVKKLNFAQKFITLQSNENIKNINPYVFQIFDTINFIRKNKTSMTLLQVFERLKSLIVFHKITGNFEDEQAQNNLKILEKIIDDFTQNENYISVNSLLDYLEKISDDKNFELPSIYTGDLDAVQILTIHASKGLEFPYVFVLSIASSSTNFEKSGVIFDMQYGDKPGFGIVVSKYKGKQNPKALLYKQIWQKPREINEALRLFYVAVSRAKKYLNVLSFEPYSSVKPVEYIDNMAAFLG